MRILGKLVKEVVGTIVLLAVVVGAYTAYRAYQQPRSVERSIRESAARDLGTAANVDCSHIDGDQWMCRVDDPSGSASLPVTVRDGKVTWRWADAR